MGSWGEKKGCLFTGSWEALTNIFRKQALNFGELVSTDKNVIFLKCLASLGCGRMIGDLDPLP